jgi:CheY-like chemotaxis protein
MQIQKRRILIAEDFEDNRIALKLMLKLAGFEPLEACDGQQAIDITEREKPDLILMDISLPTVDGLQATRAIRLQSEFQFLPIIIVSAHDSDQSRNDAKAAGGSSYVTKPIEFEELRKVIEGHLSAEGAL